MALSIKRILDRMLASMLAEHMTLEILICNSESVLQRRSLTREITYHIGFKKNGEKVGIILSMKIMHPTLRCHSPTFFAFPHLNWLLLRYNLYLSLILASFSEPSVYQRTCRTHITIVSESHRRTPNMIGSIQYQLPLPSRPFRAIAVSHLWSALVLVLPDIFVYALFYSLIPIFFQSYSIISYCTYFFTSPALYSVHLISLQYVHSLRLKHSFTLFLLDLDIFRGKKLKTHFHAFLCSPAQRARCLSHSKSIWKSINLVKFISTAIDFSLCSSESYSTSLCFYLFVSASFSIFTSLLSFNTYLSILVLIFISVLFNILSSRLIFLPL